MDKLSYIQSVDGDWIGVNPRYIVSIGQYLANSSTIVFVDGQIDDQTVQGSPREVVRLLNERLGEVRDEPRS